MHFLNNCKHQETYKILLKDWNDYIKIKIFKLNKIKKKSIFIVNVNFHSKLREKYEKKFISVLASASTSLSNDNINSLDFLVIF